ncbi:MAG: aminotransferase class I/II-fold pyridoxal phosphate-dependent enzyme [ANME-2 cluster archaeon]|nr:aminotransferase class I/II-fold pyridoxal phosphate-dependent enzyme [ANME-2 cluster archaeon]
MSNIDRFIRKSVVDINPCIHGGRIAENSELSGHGLLDFSANLNPMGPYELDTTREIIGIALENIHFYPDNRYKGFKSSAANFAGAEPENIIPMNGSSELIRLIAETVLEQGDTVLLPQPTFDEYELSIKLMGAIPEHIEYRKVYQGNGEIDEGLLSRSKAVFICNPNNPTGTLIAGSDLEKLARKCQHNETFLVVDEAFIELSDPAQSIAWLVNENPFVIVMRSMTKVFAIPGMRIGYGIAHRDLAVRMENIRIPWNLGTIQDTVGSWLLDTHTKDPSYLERTRKLITEERLWLTGRLSLIRGFYPVPSSTNFILINIREFGMDSGELTERMRHQGILVRDCNSFRRMGHDYIRVAVRTHEENQRLVDALGESVAQWGRELAEKNIDEAIHQGTIASRTNCEYYPCHFEGQDCTFCFCPFYPCLDERTGGHMVERRTGGEVWSCAGCDTVHRPEVANPILEALMACADRPGDLRHIWKQVIEPLL